MGKRLILIMLIMNSSRVNSQIEIVVNDYFKFGNEYYRGILFDELDSINLAISSGENQVWDFSWLEDDDTDTLRIIKADLTPFGNEFPDASFGISSNEANYFYQSINPQGVKLLGRVNYDAIFDFNTVYRFNATGNSINFPLRYQDTYEFSYSYFVQYPTLFPGTDSIRVWNGSSFDLEVDAFGQLSLPNGSYEVLRLKQTAYIADTVSVYDEPGGWSSQTINRDTSISWLFYAKSVGYRLLAFSQNINGFGKSVGWVKDYVLSNGEEMLSINDIRIYPQPSNQFVYLKHNDFVEYEILNIQGKLVHKGNLLPNDEKIDVRFLSSGMYILRTKSQKERIVKATKLVIASN